MNNFEMINGPNDQFFSQTNDMSFFNQDSRVQDQVDASFCNSAGHNISYAIP